MDRTSPESLKQLEAALELKMGSVLAPMDFSKVGGVDPLIQIINRSDRATERLSAFIASDQFGHERIGGRLLVGVRACTNAPGIFRQAGQQLAYKTRLADAGLAVDMHDLAISREHVAVNRIQAREFRLAADDLLSAPATCTPLGADHAVHRHGL